MINFTLSRSVLVEKVAAPAPDAAGDDLARQLSLHAAEEHAPPAAGNASGRVPRRVVHDFRNVLTAIKGYGELLLEDFDAGDSRQELVKRILTAVDAASEMTRELLGDGAPHTPAADESAALMFKGGTERPHLHALTTGGSETILLVEDEPQVAEVVTHALGDAGYTVLAASHGSEALELVQESARRIDLLLTDVAMPGMDGPELAHRVKQAHPDIRVVYMSGYLDAAMLRADGEAAAARFIAKPFSIKALTGMVREALAA